MLKYLTDHLDTITPFEVRFVFARKNRKMLTDKEVVALSGLPLEAVQRIGSSLSWDAIKASEIEAFCKACGHDPLRPADAVKYLKRVADGKITLTHLNKQQRERLQKLYGELEHRSNKNSGPAS